MEQPLPLGLGLLPFPANSNNPRLKMLLRLQTVKDYLGSPVSADAAYDALLTELITAVEKQAARFCNRICSDADGKELVTLEYTEGIEEILDGAKSRESLRVSVYPIAKVTSVKGSMFAGGSFEDTVEDSEYFVMGYFGEILIASTSRNLFSMFEIVKVTYNGGYLPEPDPEADPEAETPDGATPLPSDLKLALLESIRWNWKDGVYMGIKSISTPGGEVLTDEIFPPQAQKIFSTYRKLG